MVKTGGIEKGVVPGCRLYELDEACGECGEEGGREIVGKWRCGVTEKRSEGGVCASKDMGEKVSKANKEPFSDGGEWNVCREVVGWN